MVYKVKLVTEVHFGLNWIISSMSGRKIMRLVKKAYIFILVAILLSLDVGCNNTASNQIQKASLNKDVVIAKVNDIEITRRALEQQLLYLDATMKWQYGQDYANNEEAMTYYEEQKRLLVDYLIEIQVFIAQADSLGIKVTEKEVDQQLELLKADYDTEKAFQEALNTSGMSLDELEVMLREDLIVGQVITACCDNITVTDEEAKMYYEGNPDLFMVQPGAMMYHILVPTEQQAKEVKEKYLQGMSFEALATQYGTDDTKKQGGLLEYIPYNSPDYDTNFLTAAQKLNEGEVSEPVQTKEGWHLIKVEHINRESTVSPYEEVKEEIKDSLFTDKQNEVVDQQLRQWESEMDIEIYEDNI